MQKIMRLKNIRQQIQGENIYVIADVKTSALLPTKQFYVKVPIKFKNLVVIDGSSSLAAFLLPSLYTGKNLYIDDVVDELLYNNSRKIDELFKYWGIITPNSNRLIKTESVKNSEHTRPIRAMFFSGGVDSFYTYLKNKNNGNQITHLILVHGFDIPLKEKRLFEQTLKLVNDMAEEEGVTVIPVETNIRELTEAYVRWDFQHGAAMASVILALRNGISEVYLAGGMYKNYLRPYGLHPDLDHLWSTTTLKFIHDGTENDRLAKIKYISNSPTALNNLRVCWKNTGGKLNCGECEKCLRTMISLYNLDLLENSPTFPTSIDTEKLTKVRFVPNHVRYFEENLEGIRSKNPTLAKAIENCIEINKNSCGNKSISSAVKSSIATIDRRLLNGRLYRYLTTRGII